MKTSDLLSVSGVILSVFIFTGMADAVPIRLVPDLTSITFWEQTNRFKPMPFTFGVNSAQLTTRLTDPLRNSNHDFGGAPTEFYDVFYSGPDGTFNLDGEYLSIEAVYSLSLPRGGAMNIAEVDLNFTAKPTQYANLVASFVALGENAIPGSVGNAIDGDLLTHTALGNTSEESQNLRLTLGFPSSSDPALSPVPEPSAVLLVISGVISFIGLRRKFSKEV